MKEQQIYDSFELSEDHVKDVIDNHCALILAYGLFLTNLNKNGNNAFENRLILQLLLERAKIEGKDFPDFKIIDDFQIEEETDDLPIVVFINFFHRLIETPNWKHEWIEFKMLLNRYKDKI